MDDSQNPPLKVVSTLAILGSGKAKSLSNSHTPGCNHLFWITLISAPYESACPSISMLDVQFQIQMASPVPSKVGREARFDDVAVVRDDDDDDDDDVTVSFARSSANREWEGTKRKESQPSMHVIGSSTTARFSCPWHNCCVCDSSISCSVQSSRSEAINAYSQTVVVPFASWMSE